MISVCKIGYVVNFERNQFSISSTLVSEWVSEWIEFHNSMRIVVTIDFSTKSEWSAAKFQRYNITSQLILATNLNIRRWNTLNYYKKKTDFVKS